MPGKGTADASLLQAVEGGVSWLMGDGSLVWLWRRVGIHKPRRMLICRRGGVILIRWRRLELARHVQWIAAQSIRGGGWNVDVVVVEHFRRRCVGRVCCVEE